MLTLAPDVARNVMSPSTTVVALERDVDGADVGLMSPITTLVALSVPFRLTSTRLKAAGSTSVKARASAMPALLIRQAVLPNVASASRMARSSAA